LDTCRCDKCKGTILCRIVVKNLTANIGFKLYKTKLKGFVRELYGDHSVIELDSAFCPSCHRDLNDNNLIMLCPITNEWTPLSQMKIFGVKREGYEAIRRDVFNKKCTNELIMNYFEKMYHGAKVKIVSESELKLDWSLSDTA